MSNTPSKQTNKTEEKKPGVNSWSGRVNRYCSTSARGSTVGTSSDMEIVLDTNMHS